MDETKGGHLSRDKEACCGVSVSSLIYRAGDCNTTFTTAIITTEASEDYMLRTPRNIIIARAFDLVKSNGEPYALPSFVVIFEAYR